MKTCIIAGGMLEREFVLRFMREQKFDIILAADRGLEFCNEENIRPTYILGDFDSLKDGYCRLFYNNVFSLAFLNFSNISL